MSDPPIETDQSGGTAFTHPLRVTRRPDGVVPVVRSGVRVIDGGVSGEHDLVAPGRQDGQQERKNKQFR